MKKWKWAALIIIGVVLVSGFFHREKLPVYAYTQDEINAAKAWLSANGYSPTRAGAEQAYQDYLDGKFGPVNGEEPPSKETPPESVSVEEIPDEPVSEPNPEVQSTESVAVKQGTKPDPVVESTETVTSESTEEITEPEETTVESGEVEETIEESENLTEESSAEISESVIEQEPEDTGNFSIQCNWYDVLIVFCAIFVCVIMVYFTFRYIKKSPKESEK